MKSSTEARKYPQESKKRNPPPAKKILPETRKSPPPSQTSKKSQPQPARNQPAISPLESESPTEQESTNYEDDFEDYQSDFDSDDVTSLSAEDASPEVKEEKKPMAKVVSARQENLPVGAPVRERKNSYVKEAAPQPIISESDDPQQGDDMESLLVEPPENSPSHAATDPPPTDEEFPMAFTPEEPSPEESSRFTQWANVHGLSLDGWKNTKSSIQMGQRKPPTFGKMTQEASLSGPADIWTDAARQLTSSHNPNLMIKLRPEELQEMPGQTSPKAARMTSQPGVRTLRKFTLPPRASFKISRKAPKKMMPSVTTLAQSLRQIARPLQEPPPRFLNSLMPAHHLPSAPTALAKRVSSTDIHLLLPRSAGLLGSPVLAADSPNVMELPTVERPPFRVSQPVSHEVQEQFGRLAHVYAGLAKPMSRANQRAYFITRFPPEDFKKKKPEEVPDWVKIPANLFEEPSPAEEPGCALVYALPQWIQSARDVQDPSRPLMLLKKHIFRDVPQPLFLLQDVETDDLELESLFEPKGKVRRRGKAILELITLKSVHMDLLTPEMLLLDDHFHQQVGSQTAEGRCVEVQTELREKRDRWTQSPSHPMLGHAGLGGGADTAVPQNVHPSQLFASFTSLMNYGGAVVSTLLEEESPLNLSAEGLELPPIPGSQVEAVILSDAAPQFVAVVHVLKEGPCLAQGVVGMLSLWSPHQPSSPHKVLASCSEVRCCCFGPGVSFLLLAGMADGSIALWDTRQSNDRLIGEMGVLFPSFTTAAESPKLASSKLLPRLSILEGEVDFDTEDPLMLKNLEDIPLATKLRRHHLMPLVAIKAARKGSSDASRLHSNTEENLMSSLDTRGLVNFWRLEHHNRVSLRLLTSLDLGTYPGLGIRQDTLEALDLESQPGTTAFFVATNCGAVVEVSPTEEPAVYRDRTDARVTSVRANPHNPHLVLASCTTHLTIFSTRLGGPVWRSPPLVSLARIAVWSEPSAFYLLDQTGAVTLWNLSRDYHRPVRTLDSSAAGLSCGGPHNLLVLLQPSGKCTLMQPTDPSSPAQIEEQLALLALL